MKVEHSVKLQKSPRCLAFSALQISMTEEHQVPLVIRQSNHSAQTIRDISLNLSYTLAHTSIACLSLHTQLPKAVVINAAASTMTTPTTNAPAQTKPSAISYLKTWGGTPHQLAFPSIKTQ